ncbi:MAG: ankyrin-2-like [Chthonomonadales bacterium]|nr:ankyrin-2-like [Chthonomonadales bacterium]
MTSSRRRVIFRITTLCLTLLLFCLPIWIVHRTEHQADLNYRLIQAIKAEDTPTILKTLHAAADGNARDIEKKPVSLREVFLRWLLHEKPEDTAQEPVYHPTALILFLTPHLPPDVNGLNYFTSSNYDAAPEPPQENLPVVKLLLERGADISEKDDEQRTPMTRALEFQWMETVRLLVEAGASPHIQDAEGESPLTYADAQVASTLLQHGMDVNARGPGGRTPLMKALCPPNLHPDVVPIFLAHGADVNARDDFGTTPLLLATLFTDVSTMKLLLDHGADANRGELAGQTPLIAAVLTKDVARVQLLLEHGAKTTNRDENGLTALAWAQKIHAPQIEALLEPAKTRK